MYTLVTICALLATTNAAPAGEATSFVSFNENHNSIQHIQSAPALVKYAAPAPAQYSAPASSQYALPAVAKVAVPVAAKVAAPAVPSYYSAPIVRYSGSAGYAERDEENYGPAKYEFAYIVQDPHTGDYHSQEERRDGDHVVGQYSLHEADGTVRLVRYSDDGHGFNAVVERQGQPSQAPSAYRGNY